jgi:hypothetical protein
MPKTATGVRTRLVNKVVRVNKPSMEKLINFAKLTTMKNAAVVPAKQRLVSLSAILLTT